MQNSTLKQKVKELEKEEIISALKQSNWVMAKAARLLGITERMIGYKVKKYGIKKQDTTNMQNTQSDKPQADNARVDTSVAT